MDTDAVQSVAKATGANIVPVDDIYDVDADIFSPNALGAVLNEQTLPRLKVKVVAGGANNQLSTSDMGAKVRDAGILYAPDYVINGGGIINVAGELSGEYSRDWVEQKVQTMVQTLRSVMEESLAGHEPTNLVADRIARARIDAASAS